MASIATKAQTANKSDNATNDSKLVPSGSGVTLQSDLGATTIQPHVVAKIAGLAVREVNGVHSLVPFGAGQAFSNLAASVTGAEMRNLGVSVEVGSLEAAIDCRIVCDYGVSIPQVSAAIRENVTERIYIMTGLKVAEVNIEVADLFFEEDVTQRPAPQSRVR
jgi:uncharacterized alkaline shock family protein YloU